MNQMRLLAAILLLAGCDAPPSKTAGETIGDGPIEISTWTDPDSGCRYIVVSFQPGWSNRGFLALAPKLRPDGSADCGR